MWDFFQEEFKCIYCIYVSYRQHVWNYLLVNEFLPFPLWIDKWTDKTRIKFCITIRQMLYTRATRMRRVNSSSIILISSCGAKTDDASSASVKWDVYTLFSEHFMEGSDANICWNERLVRIYIRKKWILWIGPSLKYCRQSSMYLPQGSYYKMVLKFVCTELSRLLQPLRVCDS